MPQTNRTNQPNDTDEISFLDLIEVLWKKRNFIIVVTLSTLTIGLIPLITKVTPPTHFIISSEIRQSGDLTTSIILTKLWSTSELDNSFSTQGMARYKLRETPYSPNSLFLRSISNLNSQKQINTFMQLNVKSKILPEIKNMMVTFPKRITGSFKLSLKTADKALISILKTQMNDYIFWSLNVFNQKLLTEAKLLSPDTPHKNLKPPLYNTKIVSSVITVEPEKSAAIPLSIALGLFFGSFIVLIMNAFNNRNNISITSKT